MKQFIKDYLSFTRKERNAVFVLLILIVSIFLLPYWWPVTPHPTISKNKTDQLREATKQKDTNVASFSSARHYSYVPHSGDQLFYFDPNTLPPEGWKRLGLRDKTIHTIQKYLAGGGKFKVPNDLSKIYGLFKDEYERLVPYVSIKADRADALKKFVDKPNSDSSGFHASFRSYKKPEPQIIDINMADTTAFIALPGIGGRLANRIIGFREKLGGFYSVEQVQETYGLPDSTFQYIKKFLQCQQPHIKTININTADAATLKQHPYIRWNLANAIVQYRQQHGNFKSLDDLTQIAVITPDILQKVKPYLVLQ